MAYLISKDFFIIQQNQINQLTQNDPGRLTQASMVAQEELTSYLVQRWDTSKEFQDTMIWSAARSYNVGDRIVLDFNLFNTTSAYNVGDTVIQNGNAYVANVSLMPGNFNFTNWTKIGVQYQIFNALSPSGIDQFDSNRIYAVGDNVYWKGYTYTCSQMSQVQSQESAIQYTTYSQIPPINVFPDGTQNANGTYWNNKVAFSITTGILPSNATYWVLGDNRSQQMVMYMTDIAIYYLHKSIAPNDIPELREKAYERALKWLKMCAMGDVMPNLPVKQPTQGLKRRFGGNTSHNNTW